LSGPFEKCDKVDTNLFNSIKDIFLKRITR